MGSADFKGSAVLEPEGGVCGCDSGYLVLPVRVNSGCDHEFSGIGVGGCSTSKYADGREYTAKICLTIDVHECLSDIVKTARSLQMAH